jgi:CubicO group peptidase (beta-lactamase class C family)
MDDTGFVVPPSEHSRSPVALPLNPITGRPQSVADRRTATPVECGGGCLTSTAEDYLRFAMMLSQGGSLNGVRILGPKTIEYMTSDHLLPTVDTSELDAGWPNVAGYGYGLGVAVRRENGLSPMMGTAGDYNWGGASGTYFWVDPEEELAVVFMALAPGQLRIRYRHLMPTLVLQAIVD